MAIRQLSVIMLLTIAGVLVPSVSGAGLSTSESRNRLKAGASLISDLTLDKIKELIQNGTPDEAIAGEIRDRGIDFKTDDKVLEDLRRLGAGAETIKAIEEAGSARLRIALFNYSACQDSQRQFDTFKALIRSKLSVIPSSLGLQDPRYNYLSGLSLVNEDREFEMNLDQVRAYWMKNHVLQIFYGLCSGNGSDALMRSLVFLGNLNGTLQNPVQTEFVVRPEEFAHTKDVHTLLVLYSLANDAEFRGLDTETIRGYLERAYNLVIDLETSDHSSTVLPIKTALERMGCERFRICSPR